MLGLGCGPTVESCIIMHFEIPECGRMVCQWEWKLELEDYLVWSARLNKASHHDNKDFTDIRQYACYY
jgi:hypothetical protein